MNWRSLTYWEQGSLILLAVIIFQLGAIAGIHADRHFNKPSRAAIDAKVARTAHYLAGQMLEAEKRKQRANPETHAP